MGKKLASSLSPKVYSINQDCKDAGHLLADCCIFWPVSYGVSPLSTPRLSSPLSALIYGLILIFLITCAGSHAGSASAAETALKGQIVDQDKRPVKGAQIHIYSDDGAGSSGNSDGKGNFKVRHPECRNLSFAVMPSVASGLCAAFYDRVSGEISKHVFVQLRRGFLVQGRVQAQGKGLKGLRLRFRAKDENKSRDEAIHGGGLTYTGRDGRFSIVLSPGHKIVEINNGRYPELEGLVHKEILVSGDARLSDLSLEPTEREALK